jgi:outer membrane protein insertion porin family
MKHSTRALFLLFLIAIGSWSCQPTKVLQDGERLYGGTEIDFSGQAPVVSSSRLQNEVRQQPNARFLGMPVRLGIYAKYADKEKGLGRWLRDNLGEPPVIFNYQKATTSGLAIEKYLIDQGYLQATVALDTSTTKHKATAKYQVKAGQRYTLAAVDLPPDTSTINRFVHQQQANTFLGTGKPYQTKMLRGERQRLAQQGQEEGFFGLSADNFYYFLDTTLAQHGAKAFLRLSDDPPGRPYERHYIGRTTVYPVYSLSGTFSSASPDTILQGTYRYIQPQPFVRHGVLRKAILQDQGDLFSRSRQQASVNRLLGLGAYKFVNLKYQLRESGDSLYLDRNFYMTPALTQDFSAEAGTSTLSTASSSLNLGVNFNYAHRNIFGGSERLSLRFSADAATQIGREVDFVNSVNLSLKGELSFPDFIVPFRLFRAAQTWQARTNASLRGDFQRRTGFFSLNSIRAAYGFEWQPSRLQRYQWNPVQLTRVSLLNSTEAFEERLRSNPRLQANFSNYLIASTSFQFDYSEQQPDRRENYLVARLALEAAGNLAYAAYELGGASGERPYELLGQRFAQFFRTDAAVQYHWFQGKTELASRLNIGAALPYGNSKAIPYVRQFFVGGSNSIRAWQIRALGPGASPVEALDAEVFQDQTGDIKLEGNLEYRFPLFSYLKGAVFADAGNIWLIPQEGIEQEPGTVFQFGDFYRQIAVGTGVGLRLDVTYFVLRLDLAFPVRKPYNPQGNRWVFDDIALGRAAWRTENLVLNLALGYPF